VRARAAAAPNPETTDNLVIGQFPPSPFFEWRMRRPEQTSLAGRRRSFPKKIAFFDTSNFPRQKIAFNSLFLSFSFSLRRRRRRSRWRSRWQRRRQRTKKGEKTKSPPDARSTIINLFWHSWRLAAIAAAAALFLQERPLGNTFRSFLEALNPYCKDLFLSKLILMCLYREKVSCFSSGRSLLSINRSVLSHNEP